MQYNQSFLIFMYVCVMMQSLCAMELSSELSNIPKLNMINKLSNAFHKSASFYCAHYSDAETIIVMNKNKECWAINSQGEKIKKICNGYRIESRESIIYRGLGVKQGNQSILVVGDKCKNITICNINTNEQKLITEQAYVHAVCFGLGVSGNNHIFTLSEDAAGIGLLRKYTKDGLFIKELITREPIRIRFAAYEDAYKSIMCVIECNDKVENVLKLYNASDFSLQKTYESSELKLTDGNELEFHVPFQISDDGLIALIERNKDKWDKNKLLIFDATDKYELCLKRSINCENSAFCDLLFYPTTSIILTISVLHKNYQVVKKIIRYYDVKTGECLYKAFIDDISLTSSISFSPDGKVVIITTQDRENGYYHHYKNCCTTYEVPHCISEKHAHQIGPRIWFYVNEVCENIQKAYGLIIPKELRQIIAYKVYKA